MANNSQSNANSNIAGSLLADPQVQSLLLGSLSSVLDKLLAGLLAKLLHPSVSVPASARPTVDNLPDDKIITAPPAPKPAQPAVTALGYTSLKLGISKAQYNHELFPEQYNDGNKFGLYQPARQSVYNRRSKIWFDATPFKSDHAVQTDEGQADGILWTPEFHLLFNGDETIVKANPGITQDTTNGAARPIQVVLGDSVAVGFSAWDFANGFLCQINVGDNEGQYEAWVAIPKLALRSDSQKFSVS